MRVSITGPESTGKSWLAENLARHYNTTWVPEYSRTYLGKLGRQYRFEDIVEIAKGQLRAENEIAKVAGSYLFCDTDLLVTKIWSEFKYGTCADWIIDKVNNHRYGLYLLCDIDLPWQDDPLREHPHKRKELLEMYIRNLEKLQVNWQVVSGIGDERLKHAIEAINRTRESLDT